METLYVPQIVTVNIGLDADELTDNYEEKLLLKVKEKYGDICYLNGFIKKSSIEIVQIGNGHKRGSHLRGFLTFIVQFKALFCMPQKNQMVRCRIKRLNKLGASATLYPMEILIPRQLQQFENLDIFADLKLGDRVEVKIIDYTIKENKLIVVATIQTIIYELPHFFTLAGDALLTTNYQSMIVKSPQKPSRIELLGNNQPLITLMNQINKHQKIWDSEIKKLINPYQLIDLSVVEQGFSEGYFKLWEILLTLNVLTPWKNKSMRIANLAEGPGGFIHSLINYRNKQNGVEWKNDEYYALTLKGSGNYYGNDWSNGKAVNYFNVKKNQGYKIVLSYGKGTGDLLDIDNIKYFATEDLSNLGCDLVTADGHFFVSNDPILQELGNAKLFFSEILTALTIQNKNGILILKIYDIYYSLTLSMIYLLSIYYETLTLIKPKISDPTNSEKYLVCRGFKGIANDQLDQLYELLAKWLEIETQPIWLDNENYVIDIFQMVENIPSVFFENIIEFNESQLTTQIEQITLGLSMISHNDMNQKEMIQTYVEKQNDNSFLWLKEFESLPQIKPIFRTLEDNYPELDWHKGSRNSLDLQRCHWGQLKLFYSELEFLTLSSQNFDLSQCILLYVGSAPGNHTVFLRKLFPSLEMILYDPQPFVKELTKDPGVEIHTGTPGGFFTDQSIQDVLNNPKLINKKLLFISDIRESSATEQQFEKGVIANMIQQQRWTILLKSAMAMLKCRFPYTQTDPTEIVDLSYDLTDIADWTQITNHPDPMKQQMLYLDGDIYFQINPPVWSTETRLIVKSQNNQYRLKYYDIQKYESQLFYFNEVDRVQKYQYKDSDQLKYHLVGFDDSYDRVSEFLICCQYREHYLEQNYDFDQTVLLLYQLHLILGQMTKDRNILNCNVFTVLKNHVNIKEYPPILQIQEDRPILISQVNQTIDQLIFNLRNQEKSLKQTILSDQQFQAQKHKLHSSIKDMLSKKNSIINFIKNAPQTLDFTQLSQ